MNKKYNILHLDDNPVFINITRVLIENVNINYEYAYYADDTYNALEKKLPDLLIVDLMLENDYDPTPGMNFIKKINNIYPKLRIMVVTGNPDETLENKLKKYIIAYEQKGFDPPVFKDKVMNLLENNV